MLIGILCQVIFSLPLVIFFTLGSGTICWKSKKQTIIANSTMEAELIALASTSEDANLLRDLLCEIPLWKKPIPPILIHCYSSPQLVELKTVITMVNPDL